MNELLAASSGRTVTILPVGTEGIKGFPLIHCLVKVYNRNLNFSKQGSYWQVVDKEKVRDREPMVFLVFRNPDHSPAGLGTAKASAEASTTTEETRDAATSTEECDSPATKPVGIISVHGFISSETVVETERSVVCICKNDTVQHL